MRKLLLLIICLALLLSYGCSLPWKRVNIDWVDFIKFRDIEYWSVQHVDYGRKVNKEDLGDIFTEVEFKIAENIFDTNYKIQNGDAAFLEKGTPIYRVKGYDPKFRLAAKKQNGEITLYQVMRNPSARNGSDLGDIAGKVAYITVGDSKGNKYYIKNKEEVNKLVNMVMQAPVLHDNKTPDSESVYYIVFNLEDGMAFARNYWLKEGEMVPDIMLPKEFEYVITKVITGN